MPLLVLFALIFISFFGRPSKKLVIQENITFSHVHDQLRECDFEKSKNCVEKKFLELLHEKIQNPDDPSYFDSKMYKMSSHDHNKMVVLLQSCQKFTNKELCIYQLTEKLINF